jgi:hypothetical protein
MIQSVLPSSYQSTYLAGSLRSTDITPLRRYYEPRRLPTRAGRTVMDSRPPLEEVHSVGSPRFLADRSMRAAPNHPGERDRCQRPLLPCRWQASTLSEGWPFSLCVTRPKRVHVIAAHIFASQGSVGRIAPTHARSATCRTGNLQGKLLSAYAINQTFPGAPKTRKRQAKNFGHKKDIIMRG